MEAGALTAALERLPGVLAATAFLTSESTPRVYLAIATDADPIALREAALGLLRDHGVECDPDRVHLASPPDPAGRQPAPAAPEHGGLEHGALPRFSLDGLEVHRVDHQVGCTVRLRAATRTTSGSAQEPDTRSGRARAAAHACLRAAESLDPDLRLGLEGLRVVELFGHQAVLLVVEATAGRSHVHLPGSALVDRSVEEAACLAAVAALRSWTL